MRMTGVLFSRRYLAEGGGRRPIFRVQRQCGRLASGSGDVNPENRPSAQYGGILL